MNRIRLFACIVTIAALLQHSSLHGQKRLGSLITTTPSQPGAIKSQTSSFADQESESEPDPEKQFSHGNKIPPARYRAAYEAIQKMPSEEDAVSGKQRRRTIESGSTAQWECIGPVQVRNNSNASIVYHGRIRAFHWYYNTGASQWETYAGASSGGLWFGQNAIVSYVWTSLGDNLPNPSVGSFVIHPADPNTIFVGTGDWSRGYGGSGLYETTDRGVSWNHASLPFDPNYITSVFYTVGASIMFLSSDSGVAKSTDGGTTWSLVPVNVSAPRASVYNLVAANPSQLYATLSKDGIYRSTNGGASWDKLINGLPSTNIGKSIALDVSKANLEVVYAAFADSNNNTKGIYVSSNSGSSWTQTAAPPNYLTLGQGHHAHVLRIHPNDPSTVYVGGVSLIKTTDAGASWVTVNGGHSDYTAIEFSPMDPNLIKICNDGGIFDRNDQANTITNRVHVFLPGAPIQQYGMDYAWSETPVLLSGTQDNGAIMTTSAYDPGALWWQISGCDGPNEVTIDPLNSSQFFYNSWCGATWPRYRSQDQGTTIDNIDDGIGEIWYTPIRLSKGGGGVLWTVSSAALYYSYNNGNSWSRATTYPNDFNNIGVKGVTVNNWAPLNNKTLYVTAYDDKQTAVDESATFYAADGAPGSMTWRSGKLSLGEPVGGLIPDRWNPDRVFGFTGKAYYNYVFESADRGQSWTYIGYGLPPDLQFDDIVRSPSDTNVIYLATNMGMFKTLNGGNSWFKFQTGLPIVAVGNISYIPGTAYDTLRIGTYGRGYWQRLVKDVAPNYSADGMPGQSGNDVSAGAENSMIVGDSGAVSNSTDNGKSWHITHLATLNSLHRVKVWDASNAIAMGDGGTIVRTTDGGGTWNPLPAATAENIIDISFTPTSRGWFITPSGKLFKSTDSGVDWLMQYDFGATLQACNFPDDVHGWVAVSGGIPLGGNALALKTTDGGMSWNSQSLPVNKVNRMQFIDPLHGFGVCDSGKVVKTSDGGTNWTLLNSGVTVPLNGCFFYDSTNGYVCGDSGNLLTTQDGGDTWQPQASGVTNKLSGMAFAAGTLFLAGNNVALTSDQLQMNTVFYDLDAHWNIVSIPVHVPDSMRTTLFPKASAGAYAYDGAYSQSPSLSPGKGYWMRFDQAQVVSVLGTPADMPTLHVKAGWNLIGAPPTYVSSAAVSSMPPGIMTSKFFQFNNGYSVANTLTPGRGYWVKVSQDGEIVFQSSTAVPKRAEQISPLLTYERITITDAQHYSQTLYFSDSPASGSVDAQYELPPVPPENVFDARFASGRFVEDLAKRPGHAESIFLSTLHYPVTISWNRNRTSSLGRLLVDDKQYILADSGKVQVTSAPSKLVVALASTPLTQRPVDFKLEQNYPNPFNPATVIRYDIPIDAHVVIDIYDVLGRRISSLEDNYKPAGSYVVRWDASALASGIYYYRMEATGTVESTKRFTQVKKMLLLK